MGVAMSKELKVEGFSVLFLEFPEKKIFVVFPQMSGGLELIIEWEDCFWVQVSSFSASPSCS